MIAVNKPFPTSNRRQKECVAQARRDTDESQCSDLVEEVVEEGCADTLGRSRRWGVGVCGEGGEGEKMGNRTQGISKTAELLCNCRT